MIVYVIRANPSMLIKCSGSDIQVMWLGEI